MGASIKVLIYGHDGRGLGHTVRSVAIAEGIKNAWEGVDVILIGGAREIVKLSPKGCETIKLPSYFTVEENGVFTTKSANTELPIKELVKLRKKSILIAVKTYKPDILIVDFCPKGKKREMVKAIQTLKEIKPKSKVILGLRPIVDSPEIALSDNLSPGNCDFINSYYDAVLIYGNREFYDFDNKLHLSKILKPPFYYTGFVIRPSCNQKQEIIEKVGKKILVGFGSGYKAEKLAKRVLEIIPGKLSPTDEVKIICGPKLSMDRLKRQRGKTENLNYVQFSVDMHENYSWATHFIGFGGNNTLWEVIANKIPGLFVARDQFEDEQKILLNTTSKFADILWCKETELASNVIENRIDQLLKRKELKSSMVYDGIDRVLFILKEI